MKIIVVDTDTGFCGPLIERCKKLNINCMIFNSGAQAITEGRKESEHINAILISRELVGADGLGVLQALRKDAKLSSVPIILMSSTWGKSDFARHQKSEFGANAYFSKKNSLAELDAALEAVTGKKFSLAGSGTANRDASIKESQKENSDSGINIELQAASEVVNISESLPENSGVAEPIELIDQSESSSSALDLSALENVPPTESEGLDSSKIDIALAISQAKSGDSSSKGVELASSEATAPAQTASAPETKSDSSEGINIDVGSIDFQVETSKSPETSKSNSEESKPKETGSLVAIEMSEMSIAAPQGPVVGAENTSSEGKKADDVGVDVSLGAAQILEPTPQPNLGSDTSSAVEANIVDQSTSAAAAVSEEEAANDLPYLFAGPSAGIGSVASSVSITASRSPLPPPMPGIRSQIDSAMAGTSEDVETLKKYLTMREQDVSVLTAQLSYAKEELEKYEAAVKRSSLEKEDLYHQISDLKNRVNEQDQELQHAGKSRDGELEQLRFEVKTKIDRIKFLEDRLSDSAQQYEKLKERVRLDIRKIRVREKELESKLEILKKDSETLIAARENKILELKRKVDLLEFNYDTLQDKNEQERQNVEKANEKIERILKVLKLALGVVEAEGESSGSNAKEEGLSSTDIKVA